MSSPQETSANADELALEECIGQLLCPWIRIEGEGPELDHAMNEQRAGSIFSQLPSGNSILERKEYLRSKHPETLVAADLVYGAGSQIPETTLFPQHLAMGACGDPEKIKELGRVTADEGRYHSINWTFAPVVDLLVNPNNPCLNTRAFGKNPDHVLGLAKAFIEGCQKDGRMAACAKHFPGDGIDDRDQHYVTSVNSLGREEWMATFGKVWRGVIEASVESIMIGHIALPWKHPASDWRGAPPATISRPIITELLREEFGFGGVIVSDAMIMSGITSYVPRERIAVEFIKAGGDIVLFSGKDDHNYLLEAVKSGEIPEEQIRKSAARVLKMKQSLGLLNPDTSFYDQKPSEASVARSGALAKEIAAEAIKVVRDVHQALPLALKPGSKVGVVNIGVENRRPGHDHKRFAQRLREEGFDVLEYWNPSPAEASNLPNAVDLIFLNSFITGQAKNSGTTRLSGESTGWFFGSFLGEDLPTITTSFGCPYKLRELPTSTTYINAHSSGHDSQDAVIDVILGKATAKGKSPVSLDGFFDCDYE